MTLLSFVDVKTLDHDFEQVWWDFDNRVIAIC